MLSAFAHSILYISVSSPPLRSNPGLLPYYTPFLSHLHHQLPPHTAILAVGHIGHAPEFAQPEDQAIVELPGQVEAKLEIVDALWDELTRSTGENEEKMEEPRIVVGGHSVGAWMACEVRSTELLDSRARSLPIDPVGT